MKIKIFLLAFCSLFGMLKAEEVIINSPDNHLKVTVFLNQSGTIHYNVRYKGKTIIEDSPLGMITNVSDFSKDLEFINKQENEIQNSYTENRIKRAKVDEHANEFVLSYQTPKEEKISLVVRVSDFAEYSTRRRSNIDN